MAASDPRQAIIDTCLAMNRTGINQGMAGNVSLRAGDDVLITPSGVPYETMHRGRIVRMNPAGDYNGPYRPSSEWRMHLDIYRSHPEAGAVVHAHPAYCTALACLHRGIPSFHYMVAVAGGRDIRCSKYATFGTEALSRTMLAALDGRKACLLGNHGMICYERNLDRALRLAVEVESLARQYWLASQAGEPKLIDDEEMERVLALFADYGGGTEIRE